jgi:hypothetical protein
MASSALAPSVGAATAPTRAATVRPRPPPPPRRLGGLPSSPPPRPLPRPPPAFDFDGPAFAALERAVTLVNRVIPSGGGGEGKDGSDGPSTSTSTTSTPSAAKKERWLSFSATASASVPAPDRPARAAGTAVPFGGGTAALPSPAGETVGVATTASTSTSSSTPPPPPAPLPGRSLAAYLALPVDQYSLLDPAWVTRVRVEEEEGEEDGGGEGGRGGGEASDPTTTAATSENVDDDTGAAFVVAIPLAGMLGIPATPSMRVRVVRREAGLVAFSLDRAALGLPGADGAFSASAAATLRADGVGSGGGLRRAWTDRLGLGRRGRAHRAHHHRQAASAVEEEEEAGVVVGAAAPPAPASLAATVSFSARVRLPAAAAAVPLAVLRPAAKLIARAVLAAALPAFLSGIAADYATWAVGGRRGGVVVVRGGEGEGERGDG